MCGGGMGGGGGGGGGGWGRKVWVMLYEVVKSLGLLLKATFGDKIFTESYLSKVGKSYVQISY